MAASLPSPQLDKALHCKYWQRHHNAYLPSPYTSADSTRLMLACFILSASDLLSMPISAEDRVNIREWVLGLQHPEGGFCGSSTHSHKGQQAAKGEANIAATFFALVLLAMAAEERDAQSAFAGVRRGSLLRWLRTLQREDGSFGQNMWEGRPAGGNDTRHSYLASCIRWMIRGNIKEGDDAWVEDLDLDRMVAFVRRGQTYDGGLAEFSEHESHGTSASEGWHTTSPLTLSNLQPVTLTAQLQRCRSSADRGRLLRAPRDQQPSRNTRLPTSLGF